MGLTHLQVYLFYPNLVGYLRVICAVISCYYYLSNPVIATLSYMLSIGLDGVDGKVARATGQSSLFGAFLDMISDRCSTMSLAYATGCLFPEYLFWLQMACIIDISSHWGHVYSSALMGAKTHKDVKEERNAVLSFYYKNKNFFMITCVLNELFYIMLYVSKFHSPYYVTIFLYICAPFAASKMFVNMVQLKVACDQMVQIDIDQQKGSKAQ